jgi:predicted ribosome-associated RNA-binding protein Tma20
VPEAAVRVSERGELVFVAEERDGRIVARRREITAGVHLPGVVEATSGVSAGERVVVRGTDQVEDGVELDVPSGK